MRRPGVRPARSLRWLGVALLTPALFTTACEESTTAPARSPDDVAVSRAFEPAELIPADLDLVVRVDLDRMKQGLGAESQAQIAERVATDPLVSKLLGGARSVTLGLRGLDLGKGDHVVVIEGDTSKLEIPVEFEEVASTNDKVKIRVRKDAVLRSETQAIVILQDRAIALVSPVETDAVLRIVKDGPDAAHGDPVAEGLMSLDYRTRRLEPALERKYPSAGRIIRDLRRVRGVADVAADGLGFDLEIVAKSAEAADRTALFLSALRDGAKEEGLSAMLGRMKIEPLDAAVRVRLVLPPELVLKAIRDSGDAAADPGAGLVAPSEPAPP
jgi:hypothetical protein